MTRAAAKPRTYKEKPSYSATIKVLGKTVEATGPTFMEAIEKLDPGRNAKGRAILTVTSGSRSKTRILQPLMVMRLYSPNPKMRQAQLKDLYLLFDI